MYLYYFWWGKIDKKSTIPIGNDFTRNIAESPRNVLDHLIADSPSQFKKASAKKLENKLLTAVKEIDKCPIRGEFKSWILQHYLAPSVYFLLMVDLISDTSIVNIQKKLTKFVKKWLNLPRCCTLATQYHPDVLKLPFLRHIRKQVKLFLVSASLDPAIKELIWFSKIQTFLKGRIFQLIHTTYLPQPKNHYLNIP